MSLIKKQDNLKESTNGTNDLPKTFYLVRLPSMLKVNRERDNRIQSSSLISLILSVLILGSVCLNVYQSISHGQILYLAQDIRTASLTELTPLPPEQRLSNPKVGKMPAFTDEFLAEQDTQAKNRQQFLNSLYNPEEMQKQLRIIDGGAAGKMAAQSNVTQAQTTEAGTSNSAPVANEGDQASVAPATPVNSLGQQAAVN